jgi:hypothetical protein
MCGIFTERYRVDPNGKPVTGATDGLNYSHSTAYVMTVLLDLNMD